MISVHLLKDAPLLIAMRNVGYWSSWYTFDKVALSLFISLLVVVYHNHVKINLLSIIKCTVFVCFYESVVEMIVNLPP
jgi:hypothetical protein